MDYIIEGRFGPIIIEEKREPKDIASVYVEVLKKQGGEEDVSEK